jgi:hypothetical protein
VISSPTLKPGAVVVVTVAVVPDSVIPETLTVFPGVVRATVLLLFNVLPVKSSSVVVVALPFNPRETTPPDPEPRPAVAVNVKVVELVTVTV